MVGVQVFVGHSGQILNWAPELGCQKIVHGQLRRSDDTEAFCQMEIVWENYELELLLPLKSFVLLEGKRYQIIQLKCLGT